jgi:hypothetical protein
VKTAKRSASERCRITPAVTVYFWAFLGAQQRVHMLGFRALVSGSLERIDI